MAILGYDTKDTSSASGFGNGRLYVSKFTLAAGATMTELHGWFLGDPGGSPTVELVIYADSAGLPGARVAYSSPIALPAVAADYELSQAGFSVALAAADYWIGWRSSVNFNTTKCYAAATGGTHQGFLSAASSPPPNPFGTPNTSGTRKHSVWAVVGAAAAAFVPQVILT